METLRSAFGELPAHYSNGQVLLLMVMETTLRRDVPINELHALGTQLQILANEIHLSIKCTVKDGRLIVLGQHAADVGIHSSTVLERLEYTIQSLQLQFTQQVRLYLRVTGQKQPYAHHRFSLEPSFSSRSRENGRGTVPLAPNCKPAAAQIMTATVGLSEAIAPASAAVAPASEIPTSNQHRSDQRCPDRLHSGEPQTRKRRPDPPDSGKPRSDKPSANDEQPWIVGDDELTSLVQQLTSSRLQGDRSQPVCPNVVQPYQDSASGSKSQADLPQVAQSQAAQSQAEKPQSDPLDPHAVLDNGFIPNATQLLLPAMQHLEVDEAPMPRSVHSSPMDKADPPVTTELITELTTEPTTDPLNASTPTPHDLDDPLALPAVGMATSRSLQDLTYETSQRLRELSNLFWTKGDEALQDPEVPATAHLEAGKSRRVAIATASLATFGVAVGLYGATRPCVVGYCQTLNEATTLGEQATRLMQQAQTWAEIELTVEPLNQAMETLEPIPTWSSHRPVVQEQQQVYGDQLDQLHRLMAVEQMIQQADQMTHQTVYTPEDLQTVRSLWATAIEELESIPTDSPLYDFAQTHLASYHPNLTQAQQQVDTETAATAILETAQEAAQLAQTRQGIAQTLENWQFARVTWIVALDRLNQVPANTLAAREAQRLQSFYQSALDEVNQRVEQEKAIAIALSQASKQAELAVTAEKRHNWTRAIADWTTALNYVQALESEGNAAIKIEELRTHYQNALTLAQDQLAAQAQIEGELKQSCIGELQLCHILSVGKPIKLQLDEAYLDAINTARDNTNYNLKAVVTDHQLMVRQSLDRIANSFGVQIEVYNPSGGLLERHMPNSNS
ncbi:MAG: hypothetical protein F6K30_05140 [Cyanothece sp. SIO2G6]|nr:hypothetical protein [Cyanothece sp. SIO2G6]